MFGERRKHRRFSLSRVARIQSESGATAVSRECTISDISDRGARLFVNDEETPERFFLHIGGETPMRQECRVVWRLGGEVGVEFVANGSDQWRLNVMKRIRDDARETFQSADGTN
jgi:hypothetical protein